MRFFGDRSQGSPPGWLRAGAMAVGCGGLLAVLTVWAVHIGNQSATVTPSGTSVAAPQVSPLKVSLVPVPPFGLAHYNTRGFYIQVSSSGPGPSLDAVNATLRNAVLDDEKTYEQQAAPYVREDLPIIDNGTYENDVDTSLMSVGPAAVSVLMPHTSLYPGGNDGDGWISVTAQVPSGMPVKITDLFADQSKGLKAVADSVRSTVGGNDCVAQSEWTQGFAPTADNYQYFALTADGLAIGFPQGQVGAEACGPNQAIVAWSDVQPYLSTLGKQLVAGVQPPAS